MTVYNELNKIAYIGDTAQTLYPIPFEYISTEDIKVSIYTSGNEFVEDWMYSTQYVIEDNNIKILSGYEIDNTKKLLILRKVDLVQDNKYREGGDFPAKSTETSFDKLTMITQQLQETLDRCVKVEVLDIQSPDELLQSVYDKLDSATDIAAEAISAAEQAQTAADNATTAVTSAEITLVQTQAYVDAAKTDIGNVKDTAVSTITQTTSDAKADINRSITEAEADIDDTVEAGKQEINTTIDEAQMSLSDTIQQSVEDVKQAALEAAQESINDAAAQATVIVVDYANNEVKPELISYRDSADEDAQAAAESARVARIWATGEDAEVHEIEADEHSSRGYADLAMAIANTPEDVPVDTSTLLALEIIKGPKGDSGEAEFSGDVNFEGSFNVHGDDNHPVKVTSLAGASASGYQVVDSNGAGDSDFEHYASGDRYGTRITNHNNTSNTSVSIDLYQSNVGRSVLDLSDVETILAPALLGAMYPVGSIYITTNATCPIADLGVGTWELVAEDRVLQGAGTRGIVGTTLNESLPNITGNYNGSQYRLSDSAGNASSGALYPESASSSISTYQAGSATGTNSIGFDASLSSSTYQDGAPVQPDAYLVNIFRRTM